MSSGGKNEIFVMIIAFDLRKMRMELINDFFWYSN